MNDKDERAQVEESYWQALLNDSEMGVGSSAAEEGRVLAQTEEASGAGAEDPWRLAQQVMESGDLQHVQIAGYNRGGLLVDWHGLRAFVPASHLVCLSPLLDADARYAEMSRQVGRSMRLRLIEVDRDQARLVMSERTLTSNEDQEQALLASLAPNQVHQGVVTNVCSFGAFVDLGGLEGLIHISEISWGRVGQPSDVLASGQVVDVYVISIDPAQKRVALSLKRLQPDPWAHVEDRYRIGQLIKGEVTNVVSFGAFVRVEDGLEGLIHISELAEGAFLHPRNVVCEGDRIVACILNIDSVRRRMGLSLRQKGTRLALPPSPVSDYREMQL